MKNGIKKCFPRGAVAAALFGLFLYSQGGCPRFWDHPGFCSAFLFPLVLSAPLLLLSAAAFIERWRILLKKQGLLFPWFYLARIWISAHFLGFWAPRGLGRDAVRWYATAHASGDGVRTGGVLLLERALGWVSLTVCFVLFVPGGFWALGIYPAKLRLGGLLFALLLLSFLVLSLLLQPRLLRVIFSILPLPLRARNTARRLVDALLAYRESPSTLGIAVVWGVIAQASLGFMLAPWLFCYNVPWFKALLIAPLSPIKHLINIALVNTTFEKVLVKVCYGIDMTVSYSPLQHPPIITYNIDLLLPLGAIVFLLWGVKPSRVQHILRPACDYRLPPEETSLYRTRIFNGLLAGLGGGLLGGALAGLAEASWTYGWFMKGAEELRAFWWGPLTYGIVFIPMGAAMALFFIYLYLAAGRFRRPGGTFAACMAGVFSLLFLVVGRFRFARDVLGDHPLALPQIAALLCLSAGLFLLLERAGSFCFNRFHGGRLNAAALTLTLFVSIVGIGAALDNTLSAPVKPVPYSPLKTAQGPNVFLMVADTLRADYLPLYGAKDKAQTPNLDALAKDAVVFRNSFAQASWTKPSFGTIFTGLYAGIHGATGKASILPSEAVTLAEILRDFGYYTQAFPNNRNLLPSYGLAQGFTGYTYLMPHLYFGASFSAERLAIYEVLRRVWIRVKLPHIDVEHFYQPAQKVIAAALDWLDHKNIPSNTPFLLFSHFMDPHDPYMTQDPRGIGYASIVLGTNPDPAHYLEPMRAAYMDEVERVDHAMGEFLAGLRERGLYEDAMIIFTADHGEEFYEHKGWSHGPTLYEEVTHVPLLIKFPKNQRGGEVNTGIARHVDLMPTILHTVGAPLPQGMSGIPLLNAAGDFTNQPTPHSLAETDFTGNILESIRTLDEKLIRANENNPRGLAPIEYYNLRQDPGEVNNIAGQGDPQEPALTRELNAQLDFIREQAMQ